MTTTILHLDLDAFFASVEQLKDPRLRGRPVIVGTGVIASCSYEARARGLAAAMPIRQALRLCPEAVVLPGDQHTYACFTEAVWEICRRWLPGMETHLDDAYGDITGTERLFGHPLGVGRGLRRQIREEVGLRATVGIGSNRMIARLAGKSAKPDGLAFIPPGDEEAFIVDRPVRDLPGVGPVTETLFRDMNIRTVRDLRALSLELLASVLGRNGAVLYERCRGRDTRPVHPREAPRTVSRETRLAAPTCDRSDLRAHLQYLAERALRTLRSLGVETRHVRVRIQYEDRGSDEAGRTLERWTALDEHVLPAVWALLDRIHTRRVNLVRLGIALPDLRLRDAQGDLFEAPGTERLGHLHAAIDEIRDRFGHAAIVAGPSIALIGKMRRNANGFILPTSSLTR